MSKKFVLSENFINKYKRKKAPFGFNGLGELVYMRTYSRIKEDGKNERWWETVQRVVEGTFYYEVLASWSRSVGDGNAYHREKGIICRPKQLCLCINKNNKRRLC